MKSTREALSWIDSHCHLDWDSPDDEAGVVPAELAIAEAQAAGVEALICVGTDLASSGHAVELARRHPEVRATVGLHPHDASRLAEQWSELEVLARDHIDVVAAIGEGGFDLYYEHSAREEQEVAFRAQVALAHDLDRALVVHSRDAWDETFAVLTDVGAPPRTVFHCFTGGPDEAQACLDRGGHLSFSGIVTFPSADDVRAAAALCPLDRVLVETDSPYLAPVPHRGRPNRPALVPVVGAAVAEAKGLPVEAVAEATWETADRLYGLSSS